MQNDRAETGLTHQNGARLSRRSVLIQAGCAMVAAACRPWPALAAADTVSPAMAKLSGYMSEARGRALPDAVVEAMKQHVLDTVAAMVSGSELPPGRAAIEFARAYGGEKIATVVCSNVACGPVEAALANGVLAQADETDDSHAPSLSHPGCAVVPAALAAGERYGIGGAQFLRAVALGYDVGTRVSMTLGGQNFMDATHRDTHSLSEGFGAAAAAGCAANLNAQQMRWLLDYAAQQSSGIALLEARYRACREGLCVRRHARARRRDRSAAGASRVERRGRRFFGHRQLSGGQLARRPTPRDWSTSLASATKCCGRASRNGRWARRFRRRSTRSRACGKNIPSRPRR